MAHFYRGNSDQKIQTRTQFLIDQNDDQGSEKSIAEQEN